MPETRSRARGPTSSPQPLRNLEENLLPCPELQRRAPTLPAPRDVPAGNMAEAPVRPQVSPPIFKGDREEDPRTFFRRFNRAAEVNRWDDGLKLLYLPWYLGGEALEFFEQLGGEETFEEVAAALEGAFRGRSHGNRAYFALLDRRQSLHEDVWTYFHEVLRLCNRVSETMAEEEKIRHVLHGLRPEYLRYVATGELLSLEGLRDSISRAEYTLSLLRRSGTEEGPKFQPRSGLEEEVREIRRKLDSLVVGQPSRPNGRRYEGQARGGPSRTADGRIICHRCGRPGHYARNCPGNGRR